MPEHIVPIRLLIHGANGRMGQALLGQLERHVPGDTSGIFLGAMQREQQRRAGGHG